MQLHFNLLVIFTIITLSLLDSGDAQRSCSSRYTCYKLQQWKTTHYKSCGWWGRRRCTRHVTYFNKNIKSTCVRYYDCPVDGGWELSGLWSDWSDCSKSCDGGSRRRTRKRSCTNPSPKYGGNNCAGADSETAVETCNTVRCTASGGTDSKSTASPLIGVISTTTTPKYTITTDAEGMSGSTDLPANTPEMTTTTSIFTTQQTSTESNEDDPFEQSTLGNTESTSASTIVDVTKIETTLSSVTPTITAPQVTPTAPVSEVTTTTPASDVTTTTPVSDVTTTTPVSEVTTTTPASDVTTTPVSDVTTTPASDVTTTTLTSEVTTTPVSDVSTTPASEVTTTTLTSEVTTTTPASDVTTTPASEVTTTTLASDVTTTTTASKVTPTTPGSEVTSTTLSTTPASSTETVTTTSKTTTTSSPPDVDETVKTTTATTTTKPTGNPYTGTIDFDCGEYEGRYGYNPDPDNCKSFIQCDWGIPQKMPCAKGTIWSQKVLTCIHGTC